MPQAKGNSLSSAAQSVVPSPQIKSTATITNVPKSKAAKNNTSMTAIAGNQGPKFTLFLKLPPEIRFMIWELAIVPRLVGFTPTKIPGIFHANRESRRLSKYFFQIRDFNTGIIAHPKTDIVYVDESSFSPKFYYHSSALHSMSCCGIQLSMTEDIERVALSVRELDAVTRSTECLHCFLKYVMPIRFPSMKELILILRPGPAGASAEDLYEVTSGNGHAYLQMWIDELTDAFETIQVENRWLGVKLTFMRLEKWEDLKRNS